MPIVELPDDFKSQLENTSGQISDTDGPGVSAYVKDNSTDRVDVYIGLGLDNYERYKNISETDSTIKMKFYLNPFLNCTGDTVDVDPGSYYEIPGENLQRGNRLIDVEILVGSGSCSVVQLTDNSVKCKLPDEIPDKGNSSALCEQDERAVEVFIGYAHYHCNCLQYPNSTNWKLIVGLVVGLGGAFLLALTAAVVVLLLRRRRRKRQASRGRPIVGVNTPSLAPTDLGYSRQMPLESQDLGYSRQLPTSSGETSGGDYMNMMSLNILNN
jgi:hypothetical protein